MDDWYFNLKFVDIVVTYIQYSIYYFNKLNTYIEYYKIF